MPKDPVVLALIASLAFALANICVKRGVEDTSVVGGLLVSLGVGAVLGVTITLAHRPPGIGPAGLTAFAAAGVAGPGIGRLASMTGVKRLGPAVSTPILGCVYPTVAVAGGVLLLGERVSAIQIAGVIVIVAGVWVLGSRRSASGVLDRSAVAALLFPAAAGLCYAGADATRKIGLDNIADPLFGSAVGMIAGFAFWMALSTSPGIRARMRFGPRGWRWFVASGICSALAVLFLISALEVGKVAVVSPIVAAQPLMIILLTPVMLRGVDRIDRRVVTGGLAVMLGTVLIATAA